MLQQANAIGPVSPPEGEVVNFGRNICFTPPQHVARGAVALGQVASAR